MTAKPATIDEYIATFPGRTQEALRQLRDLVKQAAPGAEEAIGYNMPAFRYNGTYLLYFGGYKAHIGVYPVPEGDEAFNREIAPYLYGKGTARFMLGKPLPVELLKRFVGFSVEAAEKRE